jgi:hypothetical protein
MLGGGQGHLDCRLGGLHLCTRYGSGFSFEQRNAPFQSPNGVRQRFDHPFQSNDAFIHDHS